MLILKVAIEGREEGSVGEARVSWAWDPTEKSRWVAHTRSRRDWEVKVGGCQPV